MLYVIVIIFIIDLTVVVQISPSSVRILDVAPYNQFTVTCTARAEVNREVVPCNLTIAWIRRKEKEPSKVTFEDVDTMQYETTVLPDNGYKSILATTENDTQNIIGYRCRAELTDKGGNDDDIEPATRTITMEVQGMCQICVIDLY